MSISARSAMVAALGVAVAVVEGCGTKSSADDRSAPATRVASPVSAATRAQPLPRLIDLGAGKCIPCKAMAPILEQLRADYSGRLEVTFIDVWQKPDEATVYRIQMIPTQIFYAADGHELARHEGFISREEILARWKALGVEL